MAKSVLGSPQSPIEHLFWEEAARSWWLELPLISNHPVAVEGERYKIDFAVPEQHFGIELDGHATHSSTEAIAKDRQRQRRLERAGWTICRFGGREVYQNVANCVWEAKSALSSLIIERVSDQDRTWFEEHPQAYEYRRAHVPGETPIVYAPGGRTLVRKTAWGRVRYTEGIELAGQPSETDLKITMASEKLIRALDADCADTRNTVLGTPPGSLPPADNPAIVVPADLAFDQDRAIKSMLDGQIVWFIPDTVAKRMEEETGVSLGAGPSLTRTDGRSLYLAWELDN